MYESDHTLTCLACSPPFCTRLLRRVDILWHASRRAAAAAVQSSAAAVRAAVGRAAAQRAAQQHQPGALLHMGTLHGGAADRGPGAGQQECAHWQWERGLDLGGSIGRGQPAARHDGGNAFTNVVVATALIQWWIGSSILCEAWQLGVGTSLAATAALVWGGRCSAGTAGPWDLLQGVWCAA